MISRALQWLSLLLLMGYKRLLSPALTLVFGPLGLGCRFTPTCSEYAMEAVRRHGVWRGWLLACRRLAQCHPWGGHGHDPVPGPLSNSPASHPTSCGHGS